MTREMHRLFNRYQVTDQLNQIEETENRIQDDYMKAVREFRDREYTDTVRDIGRASETLIKNLCDRHYKEENRAESTGSQINQLSNSDEGIASYIGKTISPAWWLRNKATHDPEYKITEDDAHFALLCFQTAVEKYVADYLDADPAR